MNIISKLNYWLNECASRLKYRYCTQWIKSWLMLISMTKSAKVIFSYGPPETINVNSKKWFQHIQEYPWIKEY